MEIGSVAGVMVKRALPTNVAERDKPLFEPLQHVHVAPIHIFQFEKISILYDGTIFKRLKTLSGMLLSNDEGVVVPYARIDLLRILLLRPKHRIEPPTKCIAIHNNYSHTYYHWITEALPRLYLVRDQIDRCSLILPDSHQENFHIESLRMLGVNRIIWMKEKIRYVIDKLVASEPVGKIANYHPQVVRDTANFIKGKCGVSIDLGERIYISRRKSSRRRLVNEQELEPCLTKAGFRIVDFESHSFAEQVSMMHHCRYAVGIHGAGMANMIFMQTGGRVMELRKADNGVNYFFFALAATMGHDYFYQFCESPDSETTVQDADIYVDAVLFEKNLNLMISDAM